MLEDFMCYNLAVELKSGYCSSIDFQVHIYID